MNTDVALVAVFGLSMVIIALMQLGTWKSKRDWKALWRRLDERQERRILRDFILAFEDGLPEDAMASVYEAARRAIENPYEAPAALAAETGFHPEKVVAPLGAAYKRGYEDGRAADRERLETLADACIEGLEHDGMVRWSCRLCGDWVVATDNDADARGLLHVDEDKRTCPAALAAGEEKT